MWGRGVKGFRSEGCKQWGGSLLSHPRPSNGNALGRRLLGRRFESWSVDAGGGAAAILAAPGFAAPAKKSAAACITIRPLRILTSATDKNPKCVFLSD